MRRRSARFLASLNPDFSGLPDDLTGPENESHRRHLAAHFIQRRRGDIRQYLGANTHFPSREGEDREATYKLTPEYHKFFERVLRYTRDAVIVDEGGQFRKRVRWWSALALLRSVTSSPAAAVDTLRNRTPTAEAETPEEVDEIGRRAVLDLVGQEHTEGTDVVPGGDAGESVSESDKNRRILLDMAREADQLQGDKDAKLMKAVTLIKDCLKDGFRPIVFCRFIPTAEYVAKELRDRLPKDVEVAAVTGLLPPADRQARVLALAKAPKHVLVCTECLSEGINLQEHFDAVFHYDLSWNPTRHEQREGRVDRFGQPREKVRIVTYYGADNPIDGIVLDVLIKKHKRSELPRHLRPRAGGHRRGNRGDLRRASASPERRRDQPSSVARFRGVLQASPRGPLRQVGRCGRPGEAFAHDVRAGVHQGGGSGARTGGSARCGRLQSGCRALRSGVAQALRRHGLRRAARVRL